jgi:hypothetical protein
VFPKQVASGTFTCFAPLAAITQRSKRRHDTLINSAVASLRFTQVTYYVSVRFIAVQMYNKILTFSFFFAQKIL